jgi:hypothetical protein
MTVTSAYATIPAALRASVVRRMVVEEGFEDQQLAERSVTELEKFLSFCAAKPGQRYTPSHLVDEAWHALIAHTQGYRELCAYLTHGGFIDHTPPRSSEEAHLLIANFPKTAEAMTAGGYDIDPALWAEASHSSCGCV